MAEGHPPLEGNEVGKCANGLGIKGVRGSSDSESESESSEVSHRGKFVVLGNNSTASGSK
jgi:hypothetical protein